VVYVVDQQGQTEDVGQEDEFLQYVSRLYMTCAGRSKHTFRTSSEIWPHLIRKVMAAIHSSVLRRVSRAKS